MMKYSQNKYRSPGARRKAGRILLFCALTAALLFSFLVLGNLLHDRLEKAQPLLNLPAVTYADTAAAPPPSAALPFSDHQRGTYTGGIYCTVDETVFSAGDAAAMKEACAVAAELYDGLSITVSGENALRFSSAAGQDPSSFAPPAEWKTLTEAAHSCGLTVCAVWSLPNEIPGIDSATCDSARAFAADGADEILFTGLAAASLSAADAAAMAELSESIRKSGTGVKIGFALTPEIFADVDSASLLETLMPHVDFLAVDIGEPPAGDPDGTAHAKNIAEKLYGSIAYYPLRILIRGSDVKLSAQSVILQEAGYTDIQPLT